MMEQGVPTINDADTINNGNTRPNTAVSIGHYLKTALKITRSEPRFKTARLLTIIYGDTAPPPPPPKIPAPPRPHLDD